MARQIFAFVERRQSDIDRVRHAFTALSQHANRPNAEEDRQPSSRSKYLTGRIEAINALVTPEVNMNKVR